ncbi:MAG: DUF2892 domain-containing protein [Methylotenera sp.]|nr:DUF2892 domain-containing protein [Oligoflexia bacterium]
MTLNKNVGSAERVARLGIGLTAGALLLSGRFTRPLEAFFGVVGLAGIFTGTTRYCPINHALGMNHFLANDTNVEPLLKTPQAA